MIHMTSNLNAHPAIPAIGRAFIAAIFLLSGIGKLMDPGAALAYIGSLGLPSPELGLVAAAALELGGSLLLIVGYRTRPTALLLALYALVTALIFHHALADQNQMFHFLKNLAMAGGLLQVVAFGAGSFSVDNRRAQAKRALA
ncbi:DoxX family protein [Achromobacter sp. ESBL13]|uniref:DoxX family protein n=1 Tax=Achromobacter sp. ESBL13 TaxID=3077328 RepID=UPI003FA5A786